MSLTPLRGFLGDDATTVGIAGRFDGDHILVPVLTSQVPALTDQLGVARTLSRATDATLSVVDPVAGLASGTVGDGASDAPDEALLNWALDRTGDSPSGPDGDVHPTRTVVTGVLREVRANEVDTLVLPSGSRSRRLRKEITERIAVHAACDVVVVNGRPGFEQVPSILLPVAGGPHSGLAADLARAVASDCDAWVDVLHVIEDDETPRRRDAAAELVDDVARRIGRREKTTTWVLEADDVAEAIVEQSRYYGLTVVGAPTKGRLRRFIFGSTNHTVRTNAGSVVLSVRDNGPRSSGGD